MSFKKDKPALKVVQPQQIKLFVATPMYGGMANGLYMKSCLDLQAICQQYGIVGFNCGRMHPKRALQMLKNKIGVVESVNNKKLLNG